MRAAFLVAGVVALAGCAGAPAPRCAAGEEPATGEVLYFGTAKPDGVVSDAQWTEFLAAAVTPRFPRGFTHWRASGQWQGDGGKIVREDSHVLGLEHPPDEASDAAVRAIMRDYQRRFSQEAVLRVRSPVCMSLQP